MKIGIINWLFGTGIEIMLMEEGHEVVRCVPGDILDASSDYLGWYANQGQLKIVNSPTQVLKKGEIDFALVDSEQPLLFEAARMEGIPVVGTSAGALALENNRTLAKRLAPEFGFRINDWVEVSSLKEAKKVLSSKTNFVIKPGLEGSSEGLRTLVPTNNKEAVSLLERLDAFREGRSIILEPRVEGVEVAFGAWFDGDKFVLPYNVNFEYKASGVNNTGILTGEVGTALFHSFDTDLRPWSILSSMESFLCSIGYVGMFDANCMLDADGNLHLLEFTPRLGVPTIHVMSRAYREGVASVIHEIATVDFSSGETEASYSISSDWLVGVCVFSYGAPWLYEHRVLFDEEEDTPLDLPAPFLGKGSLPERFKPIDMQRRTKDKGKWSLTWGDRPFVIVGKGKTLLQAKLDAYHEIDQYQYWGGTYRPDIADNLLSKKTCHAKMLFDHNIINKQRYESAVQLGLIP
jgi:phosphoribosylamine--glycine ligase